MIGDSLYLFMNGEHVGTLSKKQAKISFTYDLTWLTSEFSRPISLSLPLTSQTVSGSNVDHFFQNLLPDNEAIIKRIRNRFNIKSAHYFDLLAVIGRDCVGALQFLTTPEKPTIKSIISHKINEDEIKNRLDVCSGSSSPLIHSIDEEEFRISIAGAQEKTALLKINDQWHIPHKHTPTTHIFKLPMGHNGKIDLTQSVENEWLCHMIMKSFNIPVAPCEIGTFNDQKTLIVERFDRRFSLDKKWIVRLPQEDFCQVYSIHPENKYENEGGVGIKKIMNTLNGSNNPKEDRKNFIKTQLVFWLLAAIDGHAKNFSLFIENKGSYSLTPIYDVLSAHPLLGEGKLEDKKIKMAMALIGKNKQYHWKNIQYRHWLNTAKICNYRKETIIDVINEVCDTLKQNIITVQNSIPDDFPEQIADNIFNGMLNAKNKLIANA